MVKTPLKDIDVFVLEAISNRLQDPRMVVPLPAVVYDNLWAVLPPVDRFCVDEVLMNLGIPHLCSGAQAPLYVRTGYQPGAGDRPVERLPIDVLSLEEQSRVVERLEVFFADHPWLHPPRKKHPWWRNVVAMVSVAAAKHAQETRAPDEYLGFPICTCGEPYGNRFMTMPHIHYSTSSTMAPVPVLVGELPR